MGSNSLDSALFDGNESLIETTKTLSVSTAFGWLGWLTAYINARLMTPKAVLPDSHDIYDGRPPIRGANFYYYWLSEVAAIFRPRVCVELGTRRGASAIHILFGLPFDSMLMTIDMAADLRFVPYPMRDDTRLIFRTGDVTSPTDAQRSVDVMTSLWGEYKGIDMLFVDTEHTAAHLSAVWSVWGGYVNPGGLVVIDDIHHNDSGRFWGNLTYPKRDLTQYCHETGFGMFLNL